MTSLSIIDRFLLLFPYHSSVVHVPRCFHIFVSVRFFLSSGTCRIITLLCSPVKRFFYEILKIEKIHFRSHFDRLPAACLRVHPGESTLRSLAQEGYATPHRAHPPLYTDLSLPTLPHFLPHRYDTSTSRSLRGDKPQQAGNEY